ncbi:hypothetical protein, partial [Enterobacter hormaechei]|uniref:hypothetical protein n=2 Tax=Enterobacteriaceae TaxID=543 RepID=UPI001A97701D
KKPLLARPARHPLLYLVTSSILITVYVLSSERISMPVQMIFRFLVPAVRSSLRCGTPQPELAASGTGFQAGVTLG